MAPRAELEKQKNTSRWRDWHHRNREAYNSKRRLAARKRALLKKQCLENDEQVVGYYWTRQYDPMRVVPRPTGWSRAVDGLLMSALSGNDNGDKM